MLHTQGLGKRLGQNWLWTGVDLSLSPGSRWGLVGASGSGKSLLMRALAGLVPVDAGRIEFRGRSLAQWSMPEYRSQVLYVSQRSVVFEGSVEDNLRSVLNLKVHQDRVFDRDRLTAQLTQLGRSGDFLSLSATTLSGGEGQILGLLRALQLDPQLLLLDEPTASLDQQTADQVEKLINDWLSQDPQRACLWTSHSDQQIRRVSDQQYTLGGRS